MLIPFTTLSYPEPRINRALQDLYVLLTGYVIRRYVMLKIVPEGCRDTGLNARPLNTKRKALPIHHGFFYTAFYPEEESAWASH